MNKPLVDRVFTAYRFDEPLRTILHEFKYREGLYLSAFLAKLMLEALPSTYDTQCLIPVPMHPTSIRQRGFNQAALLAQHLSRHLKRPINQTHCKKIIHTPHQAGLDAKARRQNLRNAFEIQPLPYQHVTLIDDLLTTGSTVNELTQQMKRAGVTQVDVICCAKACTP